MVLTSGAPWQEAGLLPSLKSSVSQRVKGYRPEGTNEIKRNDYCMTHCWRAVNISGGRVSSYVRVSECGWLVRVLHSVSEHHH